MITVSRLLSTEDKDLHDVFMWQARIGLAPKFGTRPIGWYQQVQCKATDLLVSVIRQKGCNEHSNQVYSKLGNIYCKPTGAVRCAAICLGNIYALRTEVER